MRIEIEYPYNNDWKVGYLTTKKTGRDKGRKNVSLVGYSGERSSVSYARYLMSRHLGRYLGKNEHVDHINGDKGDDRIENYQILTPSENTRKSTPPREQVILSCYNCKKVFKRQANKWKHKAHKTKPFCDRECLYEWQRK
jgi:hypothetical protein